MPDFLKKLPLALLLATTLLAMEDYNPRPLKKIPSDYFDGDIIELPDTGRAQTRAIQRSLNQLTSDLNARQQLLVIDMLNDKAGAPINIAFIKRIIRMTKGMQADHKLRFIGLITKVPFDEDSREVITRLQVLAKQCNICQEEMLSIVSRVQNSQLNCEFIDYLEQISASLDDKPAFIKSLASVLPRRFNISLLKTLYQLTRNLGCNDYELDILYVLKTMHSYRLTDHLVSKVEALFHHFVGLDFYKYRLILAVDKMLDIMPDHYLTRKLLGRFFTVHHRLSESLRFENPIAIDQLIQILAAIPDRRLESVYAEFYHAGFDAIGKIVQLDDEKIELMRALCAKEFLKERQNFVTETLNNLNTTEKEKI